MSKKNIMKENELRNWAKIAGVKTISEARFIELSEEEDEDELDLEMGDEESVPDGLGEPELDAEPEAELEPELGDELPDAGGNEELVRDLVDAIAVAITDVAGVEVEVEGGEPEMEPEIGDELGEPELDAEPEAELEPEIAPEEEEEDEELMESAKNPFEGEKDMKMKAVSEAEEVDEENEVVEEEADRTKPMDKKDSKEYKERMAKHRESRKGYPKSEAKKIQEIARRVALLLMKESKKAKAKKVVKKAPVAKKVVKKAKAKAKKIIKKAKK